MLNVLGRTVSEAREGRDPSPRRVRDPPALVRGTACPAVGVGGRGRQAESGATGIRQAEGCGPRRQARAGGQDRGGRGREKIAAGALPRGELGLTIETDTC